MKTALIAFLLTGLWATGELARAESAGGPVWDVQFLRTRAGQRDAYLSSLAKNAKPIWEEEKKQGLILDYKIFNNLTQHDPQEWDVGVAIEFKNFAALDGFEAREQEIAAKIAGAKRSAVQELEEKHIPMRDVVSTKLIQELMLK